MGENHNNDNGSRSGSGSGASRQLPRYLGARTGTRFVERETAARNVPQNRFLVVVVVLLLLAVGVWGAYREATDQETTSEQARP